MIKRPTHKQQLLPRQNSTNSRPFATPTGVVNLVVQLKTILLSNCFNSALSQVFPSTTLAALSHVNQSVKTKPPWVPVKPKLWPPMSVPQNSSHWNIVPKTLSSQKHTVAPRYTTTTIPPFNGWLQWP